MWNAQATWPFARTTPQNSGSLGACTEPSLILAANDIGNCTEDLNDFDGIVLTQPLGMDTLISSISKAK